MRADTADWVRFAESDFGAACREHALPQGPNTPAVCFHAQQCVEKLIKALIVERRGQFSKTHDLTWLSSVATALEPRWTPVQADLDQLEPGSVVHRYPGAFPSAKDATDALAACTRLRSDLLALL